MTPKTTRTKSKKTSFTISYRVDGEVLSELEKGAAPYGMSVHDYARQRLFDSLDRRGEAQMVEESRRTRRRVESLRGDLAAMLLAILLNPPNAEREMVQNWVDKHLTNRDKDEEGG